MQIQEFVSAAQDPICARRKIDFRVLRSESEETSADKVAMLINANRWSSLAIGPKLNLLVMEFSHPCSTAVRQGLGVMIFTSDNTI